MILFTLLTISRSLYAVTLELESTPKESGKADVSVNINGVAEEIYGFQLNIINAEPDALEYQSSDSQEALTENWHVESYVNDENEIIVGGISTAPIPVDSNGTLISLEFEFADKKDDNKSVALSLSSEFYAENSEPIDESGEEPEQYEVQVIQDTSLKPESDSGGGGGCFIGAVSFF
jgi:hypothetical protein